MNDIKPTIATGTSSNKFLLLNATIALLYFSWWFNFSQMGNPILYIALFIGEIYHIVMALAFWFTIRRPKHEQLEKLPTVVKGQPTVDIFLTVAGEPVEIVSATVHAIKSILYPFKKIYILNDSFVAGKDNWEEYEKLAESTGIECITRRVPGGAKAGNINNALSQTHGDIVVIFDADMAPHPNFLEKVLPYFSDKKVGFVQTPQFYNNADENEITGSSWEQQEFFFGPIMIGKDSSNASFICGTNVAIRRTTLDQIGGLNETSIAEDFVTSLLIHQKGWKSHYVSEVLAEGLAPQDLLSYYKQQLRWARGSLEILFTMNPLFVKGLTWQQKIEYLSSALFYCNGLVVAIDIIMPLLFLFFGLSAVTSTTTLFAVYFIPFMVFTLYTLQQTSGRAMSLRAIAFTQSSWVLQIQAFFSALLKQKMAFAITPKQAQTGNFLSLAYIHIGYIVLTILGTIIGVARFGLTPALMTNVSWAVFNCVLFLPYISAAYNWGDLFSGFNKQPQKLTADITHD